MKDKETITIPLEEYKELLIIKGKYLANQGVINYPFYPIQTYPTYPYYYTITCGNTTNEVK